jgi:hypothetical protein
MARPRTNGARGWWENISVWLVFAAGRKGFFLFLAVMNVLCFVFVYVLGDRGDVNVTFYGGIFRW